MPSSPSYLYLCTHPENCKLEHHTAPFNKLHQLIRQFIVINSMPTKHTFITHHPIIYAQLRYLTQQYALALLQASDAHDLATANIGLQEVICHWHIIPLPETNHPNTIHTTWPNIIPLLSHFQNTTFDICSLSSIS